MRTERKMKKKIILSILILMAIIIAIPLCYIVYLQAQYHRIEDYQTLEIQNHSDSHVKYQTPYTVMSYNIGFGSYSPEFSFFMDQSVQKDTKKQIIGKYGKGISKEDVEKNTKKSIEIAKEYACDFYLLQEVDTNSDRSYHIDQSRAFSEEFKDYEHVFASNFHSGFLVLPLSDMHGSVNSGLLTLSRHNITSSTRRSFPVSDSFLDKFFDLDRAFSVNRIALEDKKELVILNIHMSAYDEGGIIRQAQLEMLNQILAEEYEKGNYIIAGGDFNHAYCNSGKEFLGDKEFPSWVAVIEKSDLAEHFEFVSPENKMQVGTCRGAESPYNPMTTSQFIIDGFIVSDNIKASAEIIDTQYIASDHNPIVLTFELSI